MSGLGSGFIDYERQVYFDGTNGKKVFRVAMLPYLKHASNAVMRPAAKVTVFDEDGALAEGVQAHATIWGNGDRVVRCTTNPQGTCTVKGAKVQRLDAAGNPIPWAFAIAVENLRFDMALHRPLPALTASAGFQSVVEALRADETLREAAIAWSWEQGATPPGLGTVHAGYSVVDSGGTGLLSIPHGLLMTPAAFEGLGDIQGTTLNVDGEPVQVNVLDLDGSGLLSIPLGLQGMQLVSMDGSGLLSIPLGLQAMDAHGGGSDLFPMDGQGLLSIPLGQQATPLGLQLADGGWTVEGHQAAGALGTSSQLAIAPVSPLNVDGTELDGSGHGATLLE